MRKVLIGIKGSLDDILPVVELIPLHRTQKFAVNLDDLDGFLKENISEAQKCYQHYVDLKRTPALDFPISSQVYVKAEHFRTTQPSKKLSKQNLGPFEVI